MNLIFDTRKDFQFVETENETLVFYLDRFIMRPNTKDKDTGIEMMRMVTENAYHTLITATYQNQFSDVLGNVMMIGITERKPYNLIIMRFGRGMVNNDDPEIIQKNKSWRNEVQEIYKLYTNLNNSIAERWRLDEFARPGWNIIKPDVAWAMLEAMRFIIDDNNSKTMMNTWFNFVFRKMKKETDGKYREVENFGTVDLLEKYCGYRFTTADMSPQMAFLPNVVLIEPR